MSAVSPSSATRPTYGHVLRMAWPVILANAAHPLLGLVDTAVIGHTGETAAALAAIAVGGLVMGCIGWLFGFLRMSTTGFVAQSVGAGDSHAGRTAAWRALALGVVLGLGLIVLQAPIAEVFFRAMATTGEVDALGRSYVAIRIWGAPAALATYALTGVLIGYGRMRQLLGLQLLLNGLNMVLDVVLAGVLGWGVPGIAVGTLIAEWVAAGYAAWLVWRLLREQHQDDGPFFCWRDLRHAPELKRTLAAQANIMLRTLAMHVGFIWFIRQSLQFGDDFLASVHVLLSFISFAAFFLDGFALPAQNLVGVAKGRRDLAEFDRAVRRSSLLAVGTAVVLAGGLWLLGDSFIAALTDLVSVREIAGEYLGYAVLYVLLSVAAFQLDGVFIGTTHTAAMRNASIFSAGCFILSSALLMPSYGPTALWWCFVGYVVLRAISLGFYYPQIRREIGRG